MQPLRPWLEVAVGFQNLGEAVEQAPQIPVAELRVSGLLKLGHHLRDGTGWDGPCSVGPQHEVVQVRQRAAKRKRRANTETCIPSLCLTQNFTGRLTEAYGIQVRELSGDINLTKAEIAETQIIVTTPEK